MNEKQHEYQLCFVVGCCYFKCYICDELIVCDYPSSYEESEESEEQYNGLVRQHKHE